MRRGVIVIVDQHRGANQIFAGGADAADARILMAGFFAQRLFGVPDAFAPDIARVAQLDFVFADVKILGRLRRAGDDHAVIAGGFERRAEIAAGGAAAEGVVSGRAQVNETHLGAAGSKTGAGDRTGHADDDVPGIIRIDIERQLVQQHVLGEQLAAPIFSQLRLFGEIQIREFSRRHVDAQNLAHVTAGEPGFSLDREEIAVVRICCRHPSAPLIFLSSRSKRSSRCGNSKRF